MAWPQPWPRAIGRDLLGGRDGQWRSPQHTLTASRFIGGLPMELGHEQVGRLQTGHHAHWLGGGAWQNEEEESPLRGLKKAPPKAGP